MTNGRKIKSDGRRMPVKTRRVELDGDYSGWWFEYRTNPPLGRWAEGVKMALGFDEDDPRTSSKAIEGMLMVVETVLVDWNFVNEEGEELSIDRDGINLLPFELLNKLFDVVNTQVAEAPLVSSET